MNRTSRFLLVVRFAVLALVLGVCARTTHSQTETGEVLGTVRDTTGAAVSGAAVTLTNKGTEIQAKATTDNDGDYDFLNVAVGQYQVAIEDSGFSKFTSDFRVEVDTRQRVDVSLQVGASSASVVVTGNAVPLDTDTSDHGQVISSAAVAELPLIGRNYAELALLSTNAIKSPIAVAGSKGGRNTCAQFTRWSLKAQSFSWALI